ncbi:MAG: ribokinase [Acidobacteriaceae bacterium]
MVSKKKPIVVVGSINVDLVARTERIPVIGETTLGVDFQTHPGGKGANQAVAVARLGHPVVMIGKVGSDSFGTQLRADLQGAGVDIGGVDVTPGNSGVAMILVSTRGENSIVVTPGANAMLTPEDLDIHLDLIRAASIVLTQLEIPISTVEHLANICRREGIPLMLDPAPAQALPAAVLRGVQWFTPNVTEAEFFMGTSPHNGDSLTSSEIAGALLRSGVPGAILKLGANGVHIATSQGLDEHIGAFPVHAVDTTAAGDSFNGAFATALVLGKTPVQSAHFAAAAAAISVTRHGAQPSMPTLKEVEQLLARGR